MVERKLRLMEMAAVVAVNVVFHFERNHRAFPQLATLYYLFTSRFLSSRIFGHYQWQSLPSLFLSSHRPVYRQSQSKAAVRRSAKPVSFRICLHANVRIYATPKDSTFDLLRCANTNYSPKPANARHTQTQSAQNKSDDWRFFTITSYGTWVKLKYGKNTTSTTETIYQRFECIIFFMVKPNGSDLGLLHYFFFHFSWLLAFGGLMVSHIRSSHHICRIHSRPK